MGCNETFLVTGAGGFIGGWLAETLCLAGNCEVRAGIRSWPGAVRLSRFPIHIVLCNVLDKEQLAQAMAGVTHVVHCAVGPGAVITEGTRNVLDASLNQGVQRFVHLSTTEVYGCPSGEIDESAPLQLAGSPYGDAKIEAEKLCWEYGEKGLPITVVRPPIVYGPFSKDWVVYLARRLRSGRWGTFATLGEGTCNLTYVSDVVSGVLLAARRDTAVGRAFNLTGPETITWNQYFEKLNAALGLPELKVIDPTGTKGRSRVMDPARSLAKFALRHFRTPLKKLSQRNRWAGQTMKRLEYSMQMTPRVAELDLYSRRAVYVSNRAKVQLGYVPLVGIDQGIQLSAAWLAQVGL